MQHAVMFICVVGMSQLVEWNISCVSQGHDWRRECEVVWRGILSEDSFCSEQWESIAFGKDHRLQPLVLVMATWRWVWSSGGMVLTGENWSTGRKTLYSVGGRWMNEYGAMVEWYWQGKTKLLGEKHYTAWVVDEWMSMEQWWNDTDRGKLKYWEKNIIQRGW